MAIALNTSSHAMVRSTSDPATISLASTPAVGEFCVVVIATYACTVASGGVSDNQGNSYTQRIADTLAGDPSGHLYVHTAPITTSSGTFTITVDKSAAQDSQIVAATFTSPDGTTPHHGAGELDGTGTTPSASVSTSGTCALVGAFTHVGGGSPALGQNDTLIREEENSTAGMPLSVQWRRETGTGSQSSSGTIASSQSWGALIEAILEGAGGGAQDTPELYGRPYGQHGQSQMQQVLAF